MIKPQIWLAIGFGLAASAAGMAAAGSGSKPEELPKEMAALRGLIGDFHGSATLQMGDTRADLRARLTCKRASSGYAIACEARFQGAPDGDMTESDLFGYDPAQKKYHWFSVTSQGEVHDHVAEPSSDSTTHWVVRGQQDGQPFEERITLELGDRDQVAWRSEGTIGGAPAWVLSGKASRKPAAAKP